jgi:hypothetical protein
VSLSIHLRYVIQFFMCLCPFLFHPKFTIVPFQKNSTYETTQTRDIMWNLGYANSISCAGHIRHRVRLNFRTCPTLTCLPLISFLFWWYLVWIKVSFLLWTSSPTLVRNFQMVFHELCLDMFGDFYYLGLHNCHQVPTAVLWLKLLAFLMNSSPLNLSCGIV